MAAVGMQEALVESGPASSLWCGCVPCEKLLIWRGEGSNRTVWKAFCSVCVVMEMGVYMYVVQAMPLLMVFGAVTVMKMLIETWGQDTPTWICPGGPVMFLVIYIMILPGIIYADGLCTKHQDIVFPYRDAVGAGLFCGGYIYSLSYELSRFAWKKREENKGKLHTEGLASYCIHPNYFGDLFTYTGWALVCGTTCALSAPIMMVWSFVILVIPNSDAYLAQRYCHEFPAYSRKTASLIPGLRSNMANQVMAWIAFAAGSYLGGRCAGQCG